MNKNYFSILAGIFMSATGFAQCTTTNMSTDLTVSSSTFMSGIFNITGDFHVPAGVTVFVQSYENGGCGKLEIHADNILIEGTINGDFSGFDGGNGGAPGTAVTSLTGDGTAINDCSNKDNTGQVTLEPGQSGNDGNGPGAGHAGTDGQNGSGPKQQCLSLDDEAGMIGGSGGAGGGAGGSYGGEGSGAGNGGAGTGSYQSTGLNVSTGFPVVGGNGGTGGTTNSTYGTETGQDIQLGSGGAGAGGGGRSYDSGLGGSNGGNGGGTVILIANDSLSVFGTISVNGENGASGGDGGNGGASPKCCEDGCDDCGEATLSTGSGGGAGSGGGSGGGILLRAETYAEITGTLAAKGGNGGNGGLRGNGVSCDYSATFCGTQSLTSGNGNAGNQGGAGGGGRIKIFVPICSLSDIQPSNQIIGGTGFSAGQEGSYFLGCSELSVMEEALEAQINLYPNPAKEQMKVSIAAGNYEAEMFITDISGRVVHTQTAELSENAVSIDLSNLEPGTYQMIFKIAGNSITKRFIRI